MSFAAEFEVWFWDEKVEITLMKSSYNLAGSKGQAD